MVIRKLAFALALAVVTSSFVFGAEVKNLKVGQVGDKAVATYDLVAEKAEKSAEVIVSININGEVHPADQLHLTGALGKAVPMGTAKEITWDITKDLPSGFDYEKGELNWNVSTAEHPPVVPHGRIADLEDPWKALQRDELETKQEYAQRVAALGQVKVGTAIVSVHNYDVDTGRLIIPVQAESWARPYVKTVQGVLQMDREKLRQIIAVGQEVVVTAAFNIQDGKPLPGPLTIVSSGGIFPLGSEPKPIPEAERNDQGLWEADMDIGPCRVRMVLIPAGKFMMGKSEEQHEVTITHDFWMGKYLVTQTQYEAIMGNNPSWFQGADHPVESVDSIKVDKFISKANGHTKGGFRLPTEAEWEYACRAGTTGDTYGNLEDIAWCMANSGMRTHPVGQKEPNGFGLYDMLGNVWEWCKDYLAPYPTGAVTDPQGPPSAFHRVVRGGCFGGGYWSGTPRLVGAADRKGIQEDHAFDALMGGRFQFQCLGFRIARDTK